MSPGWAKHRQWKSVMMTLIALAMAPEFARAAAAVTPIPTIDLSKQAKDANVLTLDDALLIALGKPAGNWPPPTSRSAQAVHQSLVQPNHLAKRPPSS